MVNQRIESITRDILRELNIESARQINIKKICKLLKVDVKAENLESDISGLFVIKGEGAYIRYNKKENEERQRFTIAHELGHFILHKDTPLFVDKLDKIMYRNNDSTTGEMRKEREANSFAASLLMPKKFIKKELKNAPDNDKDPISYLAKKFKVSEQAMTYRLANLDYDIGYY